MRLGMLGAVSVILFAAGASLAGFDAQGLPVGRDGVITKANLDGNETWPLTIDRATFVCDGEAVFLSDGKSEYPLNGVAKTLARQHPEHRRPLEEIWRRDDEVMKNLHDAPAGVKVVRINITPVLTRGERWCRER